MLDTVKSLIGNDDPCQKKLKDIILQYGTPLFLRQRTVRETVDLYKGIPNMVLFDIVSGEGRQHCHREIIDLSKNIIILSVRRHTVTAKRPSKAGAKDLSEAGKPEIIHHISLHALKGDKNVRSVLGTICITQYCHREQLIEAMRKNLEHGLGTLAIHAGYMTASEQPRDVQTHEDKRFGEIAINEGYLTEVRLQTK